MTEISLCIVGAGGSYTPEIVEGVLARPDLGIAELSLVDSNPERLTVMAGLTRRMVAAAGRRIEVHESTDLATAAKGADFVVTQIRVGGMAARQIDETIPLRYGVIGQETTGPGGMFKALRTIPVMIQVAQVIDAVNESVDATKCQGQGDCHQGDTCLTHHLWCDLSLQIHDFLSGISLADLVTRREVQEVAQRQDQRRCNGKAPHLDKIEASAVE